MKNAGYSDFINKVMATTDKVPRIIKLREKANSKPWFDTEITSGV